MPPFQRITFVRRIKHSFSYRYWCSSLFEAISTGQGEEGRKRFLPWWLWGKCYRNFLGAKVLARLKHFRGDSISLLWVWLSSLGNLRMAAKSALCAIRLVCLPKVPDFENREIFCHLGASYNYEICASCISRLSRKFASANNAFANHIVARWSCDNCALLICLGVQTQVQTWIKRCNDMSAFIRQQMTHFTFESPALAIKHIINGCTLHWNVYLYFKQFIIP